MYKDNNRLVSDSMEVNDEPMVSVCVLTYNQEEYVRKCLDSIVAQKVNFKYEIVVGDDCSSDSTQEILKEYDKKYPGVFHMILRDENIGITRNLYDVLMHCRGKYIAGIEGDDYWIDDGKMQLQYDFLESHPEYIGCSHAIQMVDELDQVLPRGSKYFDTVHWSYYKELYTFEQFKRFEMPGQGSTWFYRNIYPKKEHDYTMIYKVSHMIGDRTIMMILSAQGDWYYMKDKVMTCYRYIRLPEKQSWASWKLNNYNPLVDYEMYDNLEKYAKTEFGKKLDFRIFKYAVLVKALERYRRQKDPERMEIEKGYVKELWRICDFKIYFIYRYITGKTIKKLYYRVFYRLYLPTIQYAYRRRDLHWKDDSMDNDTWGRFKKESVGKSILIFGAGVGCRELVRKYGRKYRFVAAIDNNVKAIGKPLYVYRSKKDYKNDVYDFLYIFSPEEIKQWNPDKFVIIISSALYQDQIAKQLREIGFNNFYSYGKMETKKWRYKLIKKNNYEG